MSQTVVMPAINFEKETLGKILRNRVGLKVPRNQRSYKWEEDHVRDLFDDLNAAISSDSPEYFLGSVIIVADARRQTIEVYDGQQRLATTCMIVGAIRDFIFSSLQDEEEAKTVTGQMLLASERRGIVSPKLRLSASDHSFFENYVLRLPSDPDRKTASPDPKKESHTLIKEAADSIRGYVRNITMNLSSAAQGELLERWMVYLENRARVIWVEVGDQATAYRIFETMNDRGLKLSAADLVKNYMYALAGDQEDLVVEKWQSMIGVLESLGTEDGDVVDYLRYLWISENGHTRSNVLFDRIKAKVNSPTTVFEFAERLDKRSSDYAALLTPTHSAWAKYHQEIGDDIRTLRRLGVSQVLPLLLSALQKFSQKDMERLVKNAVNWSVRCLLAGVSSANLEGHYSKNAKAVFDGTLKTVESIASAMASIIPADDRFKSAVASASVPTASLARYYLRTLQIIADGGDQYIPSDKKTVTREHILPQKPDESWNIVSEDDRALAKRLLNRLGNQALLTIDENSDQKYGSRCFKIKKPVLKNSEFSLTRLAGEIEGDQWWESQIADRGRQLASYAVQAWPMIV